MNSLTSFPIKIDNLYPGKMWRSCKGHICRVSFLQGKVQSLKLNPLPEGPLWHTGGVKASPDSFVLRS